MNRTEIQIRDPFIVPVAESRIYYMFGTTDRDCWDSPGVGFDAFKSADLENWEGPIPVFRPAPGFWGEKNFWAPEVHRWRGKVFMFATFNAQSRKLGTMTLAAPGLEGPFTPLGNAALTPADWECLDGTLYEDKSGKPWMVFCHAWTQIGDGTICAMPLSDGLDRVIGEPVLLFRASEAPWAVGYHKERTSFVTDGPFMHRMQDGTLLMLWSGFSAGGYTIACARSESGDILGPWIQDREPLFGRDGGHGMVFRTFEGQLMLSIHRPNDRLTERPLFLPIEEAGGTLRVAENPGS